MGIVETNLDALRLISFDMCFVELGGGANFPRSLLCLGGCLFGRSIVETDLGALRLVRSGEVVKEIGVLVSLLLLFDFLRLGLFIAP